ncbi:MAG: hypothetical protein IPM12_05240 [Flavobacteriales bacterium]|nr:hypothetical protein [Flavobacteriales bacterium]
MVPVLKVASICICVLFTASCARQGIQVFYTANDQLELKDDQWLHENDSVAVLYNFYGSGGSMSFVIFNKSNKPLFINWKNSALILNGQKMQYWSDAVEFSGSATTKSTSSTRTVMDFDWAWVTQSRASSSIASVTTGSMVRNEMISSLPPQSYIGLKKYRLIPELLDFSGSSVVEIEVSKPDRPAAKEQILQMTFSKQNSPALFRNFLQLSFSEEMKDVFYIDDEFWVNQAHDMRYRQFQGKMTPGQSAGERIYSMPYKKRSSFYWRYVGGDRGFEPKPVGEN